VSEVRRTRATPVEPGDLEVMLERAPDEPDPMLRKAIVDCRDKLPPKPRQAFDSRLVSAGGQDDVELAESLGMKLNTFLQNFTRARQLLVDCLKRKGIAL
jgi:RNA polymerase sigma-70 factor (ECF subfamily)